MRVSRTVRVAQNAIGPRTGAPYHAPATLPPKPAWLQLGAHVAILTPVNDRCASGVVGEVYCFRATEDGATWEVQTTRTGSDWHALDRIALWKPPDDGFEPWPGTPVKLALPSKT